MLLLDSHDGAAADAVGAAAPPNKDVVALAPPNSDELAAAPNGLEVAATGAGAALAVKLLLLSHDGVLMLHAQQPCCVNAATVSN